MTDPPPIPHPIDKHTLAPLGTIPRYIHTFPTYNEYTSLDAFAYFFEVKSIDLLGKIICFI